MCEPAHSIARGRAGIQRRVGEQALGTFGRECCNVSGALHFLCCTRLALWFKNAGWGHRLALCVGSET